MFFDFTRWDDAYSVGTQMAHGQQSDTVSKYILLYYVPDFRTLNSKAAAAMLHFPAATAKLQY
jgi:hypothetical protein